MKMRDLKPGQRFKMVEPRQQRGEFIMLQLHLNLNAVGVDGVDINYGRRIWANPATGDTWGSASDDNREVELIAARSSADTEQRASTPHVGGSNPSARASIYDDALDALAWPLRRRNVGAYGASKHENLASIDFDAAILRGPALKPMSFKELASIYAPPHGSLTHDERVYHVPVDHPRVKMATVFFRKPKAAVEWGASVAYCHVSDQFSKKTGRRLARNRFLQNPMARHYGGITAPTYRRAQVFARDFAPRV